MDANERESERSEGVNLDFRNVNSLWGSVLVETLARSGVRLAVVSPGSRSTPITMALARQQAIEAVPVLDERSAAFFALGVAKQTRRPVVLVCTSGTAGANYFPAVIEAHESGVPLLVITADRPPELRDCASGQTIDQQKLFGAHVNFFHELAVPVATKPMLAYLRQTVTHAVERTLTPQAGPVHLNAPFRDPLPPIEDGSAAALKGEIDEAFFTLRSQMSPVLLQSLIWMRPTIKRGVIVAGPDRCSDQQVYVGKVRALAAELGWPVLADVLSPLRANCSVGEVVTGYDAILRNEAMAAELKPDMVLCLGGWPTSKVLRSWVAAAAPEMLLVAPTMNNRDALHGRTTHVAASIEVMAVGGETATEVAFREKWHACERAVRVALDRTLAAETEMFEPKAAWLLGHKLRRGTPVLVANSMPVRDAEYFWPAGGGQAVYFNRGANGIDGTLSTALGVAHGAGQPAVLLTGDLALLHDANGFLLRTKLRGSLTIVLINNRGGGIFGHLPVAQFEEAFERFFATPQDVDFAKLCAAHGVAHRVVKSWAEFEKLISKLPASGVRVLEVRTDRTRDAAERKKLFAELTAKATG